MNDLQGESPGGEPGIRALEISNRIIDLLASQNKRLSAAEIARVLDMTPPRVWRYLNSLEAIGYIDSSDPKRTFALGGRLARLGQLVTDRTSINEVARPHLLTLRDTLSEAVYLTVPLGDHAVVIASLDSGGPISLRLAVGVTFYGHASASGRVLMAFSSDEKRERFLKSPPERRGHDSIDDPAALARRFELIRERYFDTSENATTRRTSGTMYMNAIVAPVFDHAHEPAGTVGVLTGLPGEAGVTADAIRIPLAACAARISEMLGATRWRESDQEGARS